MLFDGKKGRRYPPRRARAPRLEDLEGRELLSHLAAHHPHARHRKLIRTPAAVIQAAPTPPVAPALPQTITAPTSPVVPPTGASSPSTPRISPPAAPLDQIATSPTNLQVSQTPAGPGSDVSVVVTGTAAPGEAVMVTSNSDALGAQMSAADADGHFSFTWTNVPAGSYRVHAVGLSSSPSSTDSPPTPDLAFTVTAPAPATPKNAPVGGSSTTPVGGSSTLSVSGSAPLRLRRPSRQAAPGPGLRSA